MSKPDAHVLAPKELQQASLASGTGLGSLVAPLSRETEAEEVKQAPPMSKTALKKLARRQAAREGLKERRVAKKQELKARAAKRREETAKHFEQLEPAEIERLKAESRARRETLQKRKSEAAEQKQKVRSAMESGLKVVVDLDFDSKMTEKEVRSLCQQLAYCYSANNKAAAPAHLHFTSLGGRIKEFLGRHASGFEGWAASFSEQPYDALFDKEKPQLVYLTADAKDTIEALDSTKIYIIGGLVDRNRYKDLCAKKAASQGITAARLPIDDHVRLAGTRVLTVNQVHEIMLHWLADKSWQSAVEKVVPMRKKAVHEAERAAEGDEAPDAGENDGSIDDALSDHAD